nr:MAG TPA: hypothetical protein [Caudoviricetes sp.]
MTYIIRICYYVLDVISNNLNLRFYLSYRLSNLNNLIFPLRNIRVHRDNLTMLSYCIFMCRYNLGMLRNNVRVLCSNILSISLHLSSICLYSILGSLSVSLRFFSLIFRRLSISL